MKKFNYKTIIKVGLIAGAIFLLPMHDKYNFQSRKEIEAMFKEREKNLREKFSSEIKYAVILNGDNSKLHKTNVDNAYESLISLGYNLDNIFILSSTQHPNGQPFENEIYSRGSRENFELVMGHLEKEVDENDSLLIYSTGHGSKNNGSNLCLEDEDLDVSSYIDLIKNISTKKIINIFDQCYSGGFVEGLKQLDKPIIAVCDTDHKNETYCEYYATNFWISLKNNTNDLNGDGVTNIMEAHEFAMNMHKLGNRFEPEYTNGQYYSSDINLENIE